MNIFEALEKGNGKATLAHFDDVAYWKDGYGFCWERNHWTLNMITDDTILEPYPTISFSHLKCNDWMPYVPLKEGKIEGMVGFKDPWGVYHRTVNEWRKMGYRDDYIEKFVIKPNVPRETSCVCKNIQSGGRVEVDFNQKCIKCGKQFNFVLAKTKTKHKEVFEEVLWSIDSGQVAREEAATIYPHITKSPLAFDKFAWKKTKMTLEWEE